ncbi:hypothetical protein SAMN05216553_102421 [Lentzea fradiae]|uniref:Uncharacterized protein n=1 Tax=Lentzea fradiae TaxID=200378 RepID=A0A1G7MN85_9PSEU|nr:hypothetical protein [Lentzea fradiae]SDF63242.1 hypothetical protein SAMN05216553_102421 [Lentzea fradiae]
MTRYSQELAEYRGEVFFAGAEDAHHVWIRKIPGVTYAIDERFEVYNGRELKTVAVADLDAWYEERMTATWRGQPFNVVSVEGGKAEAGYVGGEYVWARQNGLDGDQYNGFTATIDVGELADVQVDRTDFLVRWKEKNPG